MIITIITTTSLNFYLPLKPLVPKISNTPDFLASAKPYELFTSMPCFMLPALPEVFSSLTPISSRKYYLFRLFVLSQRVLEYLTTLNLILNNVLFYFVLPLVNYAQHYACTTNWNMVLKFDSNMVLKFD